MPLYRIRQIALGLDATEADLSRRIAAVLHIPPRELIRYTIERKSVDARDKRAIRLVFGVSAETAREPRASPSGAWQRIEAPERYSFSFPPPRLDHRPVVVGAGPAGLFCALLLAEAGLKPLVLERGDDVGTRGAAVAAFFGGGKLDPESNIQFGEGGAGTFSDGKLTTQVNDPRRRNLKVIDELLMAGAPPEIAFVAKPHIGTDCLVTVVRNLREKIQSLGGELRFRSRVESLLLDAGRVRGVIVSLPGGGGVTQIDSGTVVLALGHSARDSFGMLSRLGLPMEPKAFAIGLRIEHPQQMISRGQYGESWNHPALPVADYKLAHRSSDGRGVYSFCMCPGGAVVNASSEPGMVACNGMSDFLRDGSNANSALVVSVSPADFRGFGGGDESAQTLAGMEFQRYWESRAFAAAGGGHRLPVQLLGDFRERRASKALGSIAPSIRGTYGFADLNECLPPYVAEAIREGVLAFGRTISGFDRPDAPLTGIESRTSSPIRMIRDEDCQSSIRGIYPCGEGAGYAGGIMSAAMDGIRVAESIASSGEVIG